MVVKDKRDHTLEIHRPSGDVRTIKLEGVSRPPQSMMGADLDHDGKTDLLLFTPGEPMVMVRNISGDEKDMEVLADKKMPNFGLVQAAGPENTDLLDVDADGFPELLIADKNFVRACAFNAKDGWKVVDQITMPEASSSLTGISVLDIAGTPNIVASDKANKRLVIMSKGANGWAVSDKLRLTGFDVSSVHAGSFTGDGQPGILAIGDDSFGVVRLGGQRLSLKQFAAHRIDSENRLEHEMEVGDLNNDGYVDVVVLDAGEQMCELYTFSASRKLFPVTEWEVFESRLFHGGENRDYEPSAAIVADLTGDGLPDLILAVHDRYLVYPQAAKK